MTDASSAHTRKRDEKTSVAPDETGSRRFTPDPTCWTDLASAGHHVGWYRICGTMVRLSGNAPGPIEAFAREHAFLVHAPPPSGTPYRDIRFDLQRGAPFSFTVAIETDAYQVSDPALVGQASELIAHVIFSHLTSHYLLHAGCVARGDQAIAVCGSSGLGKSTTTAFLVAAGMGYMSDEITPISRTTGRVTPFPLRLGLRPGPARALFADVPGEMVAHGADEKRLIHPDHMGVLPGVTDRPLHALIFLSRDPTARLRTLGKFRGHVRLAFTSTTPEFERDLLEATGAELLARDSTHPRLVWLSLHVTTPSRFPAALKSVTQAHGLLPAMVQTSDATPVDFDRDPVLVPLPRAVGILETTKHVFGDQKNALLKTEHDGKLTRMASELADLLTGVSFYRLSPGRADRMVSLLEELP